MSQIPDEKPTANGRGELLPHHRDDLRTKSGLSDATIDAAGLFSITDADRVNELLGNYLSTKTVRAMGACLAFPFLDAEGKQITFANGDGTLHPFIRLK